MVNTHSQPGSDSAVGLASPLAEDLRRDPQADLPEDGWFEHPVKVHPHHTDYAGIVWHGTYLTWMEEARVEALRSVGLEYADLVELGCDLPVVDLSIRYHRSATMGAELLIRARMREVQGIRLEWEYEMLSIDRTICYTSATVTLVPLRRDNGKVMRKIPPILQAVLTKLAPRSS